MSVVRQLVCVAAVEALRGRTLAGDDVYDSKIDTLPDLLRNSNRPALIVSVEESAQGDGGQWEGGLLGRATVLTMLVQAVVVAVTEIETEDGLSLIPGIAETDAAYEATLNLLDRQWRAALHDHADDWSRVFRGLVTGIGKISDTRAVDPQAGRKYACRFTQVSLAVVDEPLPGDPAPACIEAGLAAMEADGDAGYREVANIMRHLLIEGAPLPEWRQAQSALFVPRDAMPALGLGPIAIDDLVDFEEGALDVNGVRHRVQDEAQAETQDGVTA